MKTQKVTWEKEVGNITKSTCERFYIRKRATGTAHTYELFYANNTMIAVKTTLSAVEKKANTSAAALACAENA